jgi:hypothetical protein
VKRMTICPSKLFVIGELETENLLLILEVVPRQLR